MGEDEVQNVVGRSAEESALPAPGRFDPPPMDVSEDKSVIPTSPVEKPDEGKALAVFEKIVDPPSTEKSYGGSTDRYAVLARVETQKRMSIIKAWEDSGKIKAENKAVKNMHAIMAWENTKKASVEAELRKIQEDLERTKAEYAEKLKNKIAMIHKEAEEKRAMVEAKRVEDILKVEEKAANYRETGVAPKKLLGMF
ncbi:remorin-like isoform X2 [Phalaenopsis equestris]|uniref:remorin-like isoform X2 n=1 Tax=Phalaenopsis equestris TaxID=78828 RepID=UPI0009E63A88|nr:remorin-like isoform X2 [Phalaenopsis equestris]